jgi:hypothetical protein
MAHQGNWQPQRNAQFSNMCSTQADNSYWKLRLRCGCQFPWCALALRVLLIVNSDMVPWAVFGDFSN